jgi:hypothetical protein
MTTLIPKFDLKNGGATPTGAVNRPINEKLSEWVSVKDFGAVGNGATDDTVAIQNAIDFGVLNKQIIYFPSGTYLVTDTLNLTVGSQLAGETKYQYTKGFNIDPKATTINFQPTSLKSLFVFGGTNYAGFRFHCSIEGFYLRGNSTDASGNSLYAIDLNTIIYAHFENIGIEQFRTPIRCNATINNRMVNIYASGTVQAVLYAGNTETTDVWEQCSFWGSPVGVTFAGATIGIRFNNCLWEQINTYGMDIHSACQSVMVTDGYCEDVPFGASPAADSCMFRVGLISGSSLANINNHLIVTGGMFNGRNAGDAGQLFKIGSCWGIIVTGVAANRWPLLFETDATQTKPNSISVANMQGIQWGGTIDDASKWSGVVPNGLLNTGDYDVNIIGKVASFYDTQTTLLTNSVVVPSTAWYPATDNAASLGLSNQRWTTVYATTGTINTSDANEKQDFLAISDVEKRVALQIKSMLKRYRFKDAVAKKGDSARYHFGAVVQEVQQAFANEGLDASRYGLFCYDEWEATEAILSADNVEIYPAQPAGHRYGLRYDELFAFIISAL